MISIMVNGKPRSLDGDAALPALLELLDVDERRIAVAINGEVIPKNQHKNTTVRDGDVLEIVRMVGGG
jgi:sulfur carrier protein